MQTLAELEQRITSALERIGRGLEAPLPRVDVADDTERAESEAALAEVQAALAEEQTRAATAEAALRNALDEEQSRSAKLAERLRAIADRDEAAQTQMDSRLEKLTGQLDVQGLELQRMRKVVIQLREQVRVLAEAQAAGLADPALVNRALQSELEALRAIRLSEAAEIEEILAEIAPLIAPASQEASHA